MLSLNTTAYSIIAGLVGSMAAFFAGYYYGSSEANEAWQLRTKEVEAARLIEVRTIEQQKATQLRQMEITYELKEKELQTSVDAVKRDFSKLRVKSCANGVPATARTPVRIDARKPERTDEQRLEPRTINLDDVAKEIIRLGEDLDKCLLKVGKLQSFIKIR